MRVSASEEDVRKAFEVRAKLTEQLLAKKTQEEIRLVVLSSNPVYVFRERPQRSLLDLLSPEKPAGRGIGGVGKPWYRGGR